jgi:hypothetical protein
MMYSLLLINQEASVVTIHPVTDRGLVKFPPDALNLASIVVRASLDGRTV